MTILVVSDSHGDTDALLQAAEQTKPDWILHAGDHCYDCDIYEELMPQIPVRAVRGNCDRGARELDTDEFVLGGKRFFMVHGHEYGVKGNLNSMLTAALYREADVVIFGHTHRPLLEEFEGMLVLNPGAIGYGNGSYGVITVENGMVDAEIWELND